jgi:hypothetical protein
VASCGSARTTGANRPTAKTIGTTRSSCPPKLTSNPELLAPKYTDTRFVEYWRRLVEGMRKAGLPEK